MSVCAVLGMVETGAMRTTSITTSTITITTSIIMTRISKFSERFFKLCP